MLFLKHVGALGDAVKSLDTLRRDGKRAGRTRRHKTNPDELRNRVFDGGNSEKRKTRDHLCRSAGTSREESENAGLVRIHSLRIAVLRECIGKISIGAHQERKKEIVAGVPLLLVS